ncbi:hypothetical protein KC343_g1702 [Hortaea werneckii]|uniref:Early meiotic induction protein 1 n=1 Tax=Hortaea werneckii TaxID=91943 RepID=A0A3M7HIU3_HORWE|nr:hypothetical protein KC352_g7059 [Hortaea werneckii]KAI7571855.1 hypothetical protein KC317_g1271 [Hortaea werneckii]KAI7626903.1 hypothetical protein KC346_g1014 [Hortaea werneckii]KAI7635638.1 hypothetical protein KC343_g1702 [Hortaea werneckii]KAI7682544.1 hypothetical protein KC319_g948 [Hortaea werneckii]
MGWLWSSSPSPATPVNEQDKNAKDQNTVPNAEPAHRSFALSEDQRSRIFGNAASRSDSNTTGRNDKQSDVEIENWLNSFSTTSSSSAGTKSAEPSAAEPTSEPTPSTTPSRYNEDGTLNISPAALAPRTMSCRQAFDAAFYCQSLGGKFNDVYRFGKVQDCSEHWGAFWFCMRNRTLPAKDTEEMIAQYYLDRDERRKKERGSSEDVWEIRTKGVERAFQRDPDAEEGAVPMQE